jgi:ABC-type polysaccharide/polyol phosphate export permease
MMGDIQLWHINPFFSVGEVLRKSMIHNLSITNFIVDIIFLIVVGLAIFLLGAILFLKRAYEQN